MLTDKVCLQIYITTYTNIQIYKYQHVKLKLILIKNLRKMFYYISFKQFLTDGFETKILRFV